MKLLYIIIIAAILSSTFIVMGEYVNSSEKSFRIELQMFLPSELKKTSNVSMEQVARRDLTLPATGKYRVSVMGNCTLYVQTDEGLFKNPDRIFVTSRGVRVVIVNQTSDVTVRFAPIHSIPYTAVILILIAGGVSGYALRVLKFE
ncbi:hypothetical protein [Thermococcus sp. Bubb.Bath]|uniref:hypothetical protein n=1 Tax=Thermococcus sp. Bubb.Bath TaxID=1638242 RepID=UPI00143A0EFF|nr:hypothetical protein [Thermococcus sp. Bubb.Bath]NJF24946.1 hypothetical protein [Thermococcus sp. Bubb.Bath]